MWFLRRLDGTLYPLYTKSEHIIGRFGALELADDASISRRHASIVITVKNGRAKFTLQDLGSKYGTFLNDGIESSSAVSKTTPIEIKIGDRIKFGLQSNTWILEESRFVTCTSNFSSHEKVTTLKVILDKLNVDIVSDWNENCTHLTMTQLKATVKVVLAAAQVKPIVTLDYWKRFSDILFRSVETPLPDCDDFVPPITEPLIKSSLINMKMNKNRQTIFKGFEVIVFSSAQMKNILPVIEAAGGTVVDGNSRSFKINESELCKEKVMVVDCENEPSPRITRITNILKSQKMRLIKETEIYLSVYECSTERYCNPKYDASVLLFPSESEISVKEEYEAQDVQSVQETQFLETASGSFALEVNDRLVSSESDDDDIIPGTDPSIISATPPDSLAPKRKLPIIEHAVKRKSARLDSWLLNKKESSNDMGESSASESLFPSSSSKTNKKGFKDLFNFRGSKKETDRASTNLFNSNDSSLQTASVAKDRQNVSRTSSLFANTTNKPSEVADQRVSRTAGLFAKVDTPRATRSSSNIFSGSQEPSTSGNSSVGKRKREDEVASESKLRSRTANLFEKRIKRPSAVVEVLDSDSTDNFDPIPKKTSKLTVEENIPIYQDSPVDVPSKMSLSQFQGAPAKENVTLVKTEEVSPMKETLDKSVVLTMPLVLNDNASNVPRRSTNTSIPNFKKFRKNQVCYSTSSLPNIMRLSLFSNGRENGFHDD